MTTEHDWPNEAPPVTVEHTDGSITHQGVRYVPEEHVEAMRREISDLKAFCKGVAINIQKMLS